MSSTGGRLLASSGRSRACRHQSPVFDCCARLRPNLVHTLRNHLFLFSCPSARWVSLQLQTSCSKLSMHWRQAYCASLHSTIHRFSNVGIVLAQSPSRCPRQHCMRLSNNKLLSLQVQPCAGVVWHLILVTGAACTLRAAIVLSTWLHEAAHIVAATVLCSRSSRTRTCMTWKNLTGDFSLWPVH